MQADIDDTDARLIRALAESPRAGIMELARQLDVARGTAQSRLDKLRQRGIITGFGPDIDVRALGFDVTAFVTLEIAQDGLDAVTEHLAAIPQVCEVHAVTGNGDLLCRVVARTNADLQSVINQVHRHSGIRRSTTQIALTQQLPLRHQQIADLAVEG